jgi:SAM-dependent methyltransferase
MPGMTVFNEYARYYDLLYRDKDYRAEAYYVHGLIQTRLPGARTILNLGCGSGRHDRCLAELGYTVTGLDFSEEMLSAATRSAAGNGKLRYRLGDVRTVRLAETFDVVISLFHVMSYQVTNTDLKHAFTTAHTHLKPGGLFLFDCWYGPGVLSDRPTVRTKELEDEDISVIRHAEPIMHPNENVVDVNYRVEITNKQSGKTSYICETHRMRYLFLPEIMEYLEGVGLHHRFSMRWMTEDAPDDTTWYLCCGVGRSRN